MHTSSLLMLLSLWGVANTAKCTAMDEMMCMIAAQSPPVKLRSILRDAASFGRLQRT